MPTPDFQCTVSARHVRVLAAAVGYLARIGKETTFEGSSAGLTLRGINESKNMFGSVEFRPDFFEALSSSDGAEGAPPAVALLASRALAQMFKSLRGVERLRFFFAEQGGVHLLVAELAGAHSASRAAAGGVRRRGGGWAGCRGVGAGSAVEGGSAVASARATLVCRTTACTKLSITSWPPPPPSPAPTGLTRTVSLNYAVCQPLTALFEPDEHMLNTLVAQPAMLTRLLALMRDADEVTLVATPHRLVLQVGGVRACARARARVCVCVCVYVCVCGGGDDGGGGVGGGGGGGSGV